MNQAIRDTSIITGMSQCVTSKVLHRVRNASGLLQWLHEQQLKMTARQEDRVLLRIIYHEGGGGGGGGGGG